MNKDKSELSKLRQPVYNSNNFLSVEQRIHIAAGFDSEKIKMIRELMEVDAILFSEWVDNMGYTQVSNGEWKSLSDEKGKSTIQLYQQFKQTK